MMSVFIAILSEGYESAKRVIPATSSGNIWCDFNRTNPDFLFKNPDLLIRNLDFLLKNVDFIIKQGGCPDGGGEQLSAGEERGRV